MGKKIIIEGIDFDKELFLKILEFRKDSKAVKDCDFESVIQRLIDTTNYVLKYVDGLAI